MRKQKGCVTCPGPHSYHDRGWFEFWTGRALTVHNLWASVVFGKVALQGHPEPGYQS